jgi:hypothetical protein
VLLCSKARKVGKMKTVKAYYNGHAFIPLTPIMAKINQTAIITLLDDNTDKNIDKEYLRFAGKLSDDQYAELVDILKDTRRVDIDEW